MKNKIVLLEKSESLTLLCTKAASHWSFIKFCFNMPLVFTSSAMCIINSISVDANVVKVPNIVVNGLSVLIMSMANNMRSSEKFENFKKLSQQFMILCQEIDAIEGDEVSIEEYKVLILKYENLVSSVDWEEIPQRFKSSVAQSYLNAGKNIPIQINGTIGNIVKKRTSNNFEMNSEIV